MLEDAKNPIQSRRLDREQLEDAAAKAREDEQLVSELTTRSAEWPLTPEQIREIERPEPATIILNSSQVESLSQFLHRRPLSFLFTSHEGIRITCHTNDVAGDQVERELGRKPQGLNSLLQFKVGDAQARLPESVQITLVGDKGDVVKGNYRNAESVTIRFDSLSPAEAYHFEVVRAE